MLTEPSHSTLDGNIMKNSQDSCRDFATSRLMQHSSHDTPDPEVMPPGSPDLDPARQDIPPEAPEKHAPGGDAIRRRAFADACSEVVAHTRRRFVVMVPFAGVALLAACSDKAAAPAAPPAPPESDAGNPPAAVGSTAPIAAPPPTQAAAPTLPAPSASGGALPALTTSDPTAVALGYVPLASQADAVKYPKYAAGQACGNCALFGGKAGDASGPCPLFAGKSVNATAWCSGYTKKGA